MYDVYNILRLVFCGGNCHRSLSGTSAHPILEPLVVNIGFWAQLIFWPLIHVLTRTWLLSM